ncbi:acyltransferase [Malassezia pachydermatis]|uniref:Carnitine acetyltransferase n=1 Tax=Malassezia pachydermatis TaxID=77020 RepID=A0A0M8MJ73_9BASI|nr:carnitine acetyltransferase [Malassezia pachydermatis]KOS12618.1 carnitine acetyltransferase [Malassezia pachydermatis]
MALPALLRSTALRTSQRSFSTTSAKRIMPSMLTRTVPTTFQLQSSLPRLPVPKLEDSLARYLKSLEPFLRQKEELGELPAGATAESELAQRRAWADELISSGLGQRLNERLIDVDQTTEDNWFDDRFWLEKAYHEWRAPLLVNSNWWNMFVADPSMPAELSERVDAPAYTEEAVRVQNWDKAEWAVRRATWILYRAALFKIAIDRETIKPDVARIGAFCMHQYSRMFGVTRIPSRPHDYNTATSITAGSRHVTVIVRDNYYELPVINEQGEVYPLDSLEKAIWAIVEDAKKQDGAGVGVMTCNDRDAWTLAREHLLSLGATNRKSLQSIQKSMFVLSIDSNTIGNPVGTNPPSGSEPEYAGAMAISASGGGRWGHNRWFDKAISFTVESTGRAGLMGEHSPVDALIPSMLAERVLADWMPPPSEPMPEKAEGVSLLDEAPAWSKLEWVLDDKVHADIQAAETTAKTITADADIGMLWFSEYGTDWIKKVGKQSPDAYIQMALQIAYADVHGRQTATYETASTRLFRHGRTDVIRSFSNEAYDLVKGVRENKSHEELYKLLTAATVAHTRQTRDHSFGKGFDRHLMGLRLAYRAEDDGEAPKLFTDPLLTESASWKLSTSGLSAGERFVGTGFGSGFPDGFGTNYLTGSKTLKFGMESKRSNPFGNGHPLHMYKQSIIKALRLMREIIEKGAPPAEAKL